MNKILDKRYEFILFIADAIYMILELIASRLLAPFFGTTNLVWTAVIGIILLSNSVGNYIGGKIADKKNVEKSLIFILMIISVLIFIIPIFQTDFLSFLSNYIKDTKIGAIVSTVILFFLPSMFLGCISPIVIKLKMKNIENAGKTSGKIYAIATIGSLFGTFLGGFYLIPHFGCNQLLILMSIIIMGLSLFVGRTSDKKYKEVFVFVFILICMITYVIFLKNSLKDQQDVLNGVQNAKASFETEYGSIRINNLIYKNRDTRLLLINKGNESADFVDNQEFDIVFPYIKAYEKMFENNTNINNVLMIGGAGYSYPKYYIKNYPNKKMDVVEIDDKVTKIAGLYFNLNNLIENYNINENHRLRIFNDDGRVYLNKNTIKYDAILNDSFSGFIPARNMATKEAVERIHDSLVEGGLYLNNIIGSLKGNDSRFLKSEIKTIGQVFKNVYCIPCDLNNDEKYVQNFMIIASDRDDLVFDNAINLEFDDNDIILTDNYSPVETMEIIVE